MIDRIISIVRNVRFRGKLRLLGPLVPRQGVRVTSLFGYRLALDLADDMQRWIYLGIFEPEETAQVKRLLRAGMTVVDAGANIGYHTLLAASLVGPDGRVIAVEPSERAAESLARTLAENGLAGRVRLECYGLGEGRGVCDLLIPPDSRRNHTPNMVWTDDENSIRVQVSMRTIDDCLDDWGVDQIDLLKIDVEGFEAKVLRGAKVALGAGRIRAILVEFNPEAQRQAGGSVRELHNYLTELGFRDTSGGGPPGDDAIVTRLLVFGRDGGSL
jgi:FkbM family methyltransferase